MSYTSDIYISQKINNAKNLLNFQRQAEIITTKRKELIENTILNSRKNVESYEQFTNIVKDKEYFSLDDVYELKLDFDILIFLSKKGIGKSYHMIEMCNKIVDAGGDVIIVRTMDNDWQLGLAGQLQTYNAHFHMDSKGRLYHNTQTEKIEKDQYTVDADTGEVIKGKPKYKIEARQCGAAISLTTCLKWKGGGFPNVKLMVYDEATDIREGVTEHHFTQFMVSMANSIERSKEIPLIIFGNTDFQAAHPLFEAFQIDPEEKLVYVVRQPDGANKETKILYVNTGGLYKSGASESKFIGAVGDVQRAMAAFLNEARSLTNKVVSLDISLLGDPYLCVVFTHVKQKWNVKISTYGFKDPMSEEEETWYFVSVGEFNPYYTWGYEPVTDENILASLYDNIVRYEKDISYEWMLIKEIIDSGNVFFIGWQPTEILQPYINKYNNNDLYIW